MLKDKDLKLVLQSLKQSDLSINDAFDKIKGYDNIGLASLDFDREKRIGIPEVVFALSKTPKQLRSIVERFLTKKQNILITKISPEKISLLRKDFPSLHFSHRAQMMWQIFHQSKKSQKIVSVVSAGTSDEFVHTEARLTGMFLGLKIKSFTDCGVAGIHRMLDKVDVLRSSSAIIVVAGMEGALPTVVSGLTGRPVIGVPTSVGYGAANGGMTALMGMLTSCSPTVSVVNINNGFGAACVAYSIIQSVA